MKTATITVKVKPDVKIQAKKVAEDLGFNLSTLVNAYLNDLIKNKSVVFGEPVLRPSKRLLQSIKEADEDRKLGRTITFENHEDAIAYVDNIIKKEEYEG